MGQSRLWFLGRNGDGITLISILIERDGTNLFFIWPVDIKSRITHLQMEPSY